LRELFTLREKGLVDLVSEKWIVTEEGEKFIQDEKILRIEEKEEFEFLIDGISGEIMSARQNRTEKKLLKSLDPEVKLSNRNPELIEGKFQQLADTYKQDNENKAYLISYASDDIKYDSNDWCNFWLIEYIPDRKSNQEPKLEVRNFETLKEIKSLTSKFNSEYRHYIYSLSSSERTEFEEITIIHEEPKVQSQTDDLSTLTIWETKQKFIEALNNVKEKILIESPWIKRATQEYIPLFEKLLKDKKQITILYGISEKDEHDIYTLRKVEELQKQHKDKFKLIHLPTHFAEIHSRLTGTHRKLVIKDNEYYIHGSFNFLSFGKNERQQVANEESLLISKDVSKKWEQVAKEYSLKL
jgi:phosphatidylserine/phosphatidylglycerophosphate/cardiolipin synthase-like enzyme